MLSSFKTKGILAIKGKLYSGNVSEIQQEIEYALSLFNFLDIDITDITEIHISGVFMLYLMNRMAIEKKMQLNLVGTSNVVFQNALRISGVNKKFLYTST
jgi:ABC-type transporter Mla MlaB component